MFRQVVIVEIGLVYVWSKGRRDLLLLQEMEIDRFAEPVCFDLFDAFFEPDSLLLVFAEELFE